MHLIQGFDLEMAGKHISCLNFWRKAIPILYHINNNLESLRKQVFLLHNIQVLGAAAMKKYPPGQSKLTKNPGSD